jgi:cystathionine gamma-synthase
MGFETDAIHAGQEPDPVTGAVVTPIYATSTYAQEAPGRHGGYEYSRTANPTRTALATALATLEGGSGSIITSSGMAATTLIGSMLVPGDHVVLPDDAYGGTYRYFAKVLASHGVEYTAADLTTAAGLTAALRPSTRLVWVETPTNPLLRIADIAHLSEVTHAAGAIVAVDNTFATPYLQRPLALGADLVVHSATKYLGGHSDVVGGAIVADDGALLERLAFLENATGPTASPFDSWLVLRGLKTLAVRMDRHCANAAAIAGWLADRPDVAEVWYPGLDTHPGHDVARRQMTGFGGMVSFRPAGGAERAGRLTAATELFFLAESLGGVESLIEVPAAMTHLSVEGTALEVPPDLVRLSVGIETVDDLVDDLDRAFSTSA